MCTIHPLNSSEGSIRIRGKFPPSICRNFTLLAIGQSHGRQLGLWLTLLRRIGILQDSWTDDWRHQFLTTSNQKEMASYLSNKNCFFEQNGWSAFFLKWIPFKKMASKSEWLEIVPKFLLQHVQHGDPRISLRCWASRKPGPRPMFSIFEGF